VTATGRGRATAGPGESTGARTPRAPD